MELFTDGFGVFCRLPVFLAADVVFRLTSFVDTVEAERFTVFFCRSTSDVLGPLLAAGFFLFTFVGSGGEDVAKLSLSAVSGSVLTLGFDLWVNERPKT